MNKSNNTAYSYFPGCSLTGSNSAYDVSTRSVADALGLSLVELDDWNCCGATAYMADHEKRSLVLSARNLAIAEKAGKDKDLVAACSGCYLVLKKTNKYMAENAEVRADVQEALAAGEMSYEGNVRVRHFLDVVVNDVGESAVRDRVSHRLTGLKVASYYGCQITRPFADIDDADDPQIMDELAGWLGGEPVQFPLKSKCCGGMMMTTQADLGRELSGKVLKNAKDMGADCIITACPLCQLNLEAYQHAIGKAIGADCEIPVLYFTQLMGVAFGLSSKQLALKDSLTPVEAMLAEKVYPSGMIADGMANANPL